MWSSRILFLSSLLTGVCISLASDLPNVTLPWGTWQANSLDSGTKLLTFQNIRFGKAPAGQLRFQRPETPDAVPSPGQKQMNNSYGPTCIQVDTHPKCPTPPLEILAAEDCLFLDVYVPHAVWEQGAKGVAKTPVVVWFYGGAYEFGAKSAYGPTVAFYKGDGLLAAAQNLSEQFIFVAGNYRLGAFGWLSGPSFEQNGVANAGLYDQRLVLQWVQDYIHLFGGDKSQVSAWGESAGAGSILHHLMKNGGSDDPLFQRAFLQSPAFQWQWDRSKGGTLDQVFNNFTKLAGCAAGDYDCLVKVDIFKLTEANQDLYDESKAVGLFPVGPAVDEDWVKELPGIAYSKGHMWKGLKSLAISHVQYESKSFIPNYVKTEADFNYFLVNFIREDSLQNVRDAIKQQYPSSRYQGNQSDRVGAVIQDSTFVCNTRSMYDAYSPSIKVFMMNYYFGLTAAVHASDLLPTFWNADFNTTGFLENYLCVKPGAGLYANVMKQLAPSYQSYLADFAVSGDPNSHAKEPAWKPATVAADGNQLENVFLVQAFPFFRASYNDPLNTRDTCSFWLDVSKNITKQFSTTSNDDADDDHRKQMTEQYHFYEL